MRKVLIVAVSLMSFGVNAVATAKPNYVGLQACYDRYKACEKQCDDDTTATTTACWTRCTKGWYQCQNQVMNPGGKIDVRTITSNGGGANTKNIPPSSSATNAGANAGNAATTTGASGSASTPTKPASSSSPGGGSPTSISGGSGLTNRKLQ